MPTGYTAGIIEGTIKTFPEFAKLCARAFGATIHMRDDSLKEEYKPRTPTDYHTKALAEANKAKELAMSMTDDELIADEKYKLLKDKESLLKRIEEVKKNWEQLNKILSEVEAWEPPTSDHVGIKEFMIEQIKETIRFDGSTKYHEERLAEIESGLNNLDPVNIRAERCAKVNDDIEYHTKEHNTELARCAQANKWVEDYFNSLEPQTADH